MTDYMPFHPDSARRLIMQFQDEAAGRHEDYEPTAEELRLVMIEALSETEGVDVWAGQLGCTPETLAAVLEGREPPAGDMLDILGMEPIPERGIYADPLLDRQAYAIQQWRWSKAPTCSTYLATKALNRIERGKADPALLKKWRNAFAIGVATPKPREER
ncbi:hypothetical protein LNAOJCKE_4081 [Methylorubrum aminovorans]|uniref:XRE family transcriptional regulator n=1 Tax=Methylorubrum aminovorans TaxID=269069 RepID=A0ABQ4UIB2_9HYPH|nr:hypothetical protein [Methylorubrum aminovorans]GJE66857.1 hypothetical protein LNAOJCKE_4081 [Methylorubrum aminovorans]